MDTIAIGCEAACEKLRLSLGKGLRDKQIIEAVGLLSREGIKNIRLYFMVGLPGEDEEDCRAIAPMAQNLLECAQTHSRRRGGFGKITVSLNQFIPKAGTPLERSPLLNTKEAKRRMDMVKSALSVERRITVISEHPRAGLVQALLSLGDRRVGAMLQAAHDDSGWGKTIRQMRQSIDFYTKRPHGLNEKLPWWITDGKSA